MSDLELAQAGLAAWRRGDFDALEELLAPEATWRAVEPGDILQTLRERYEQGFTMGPIELLEGGPGTIILLSRPAEVGGPDWPEETVIAITFRAGKVVAMQDHRTLPDARRASNQA